MKKIATTFALLVLCATSAFAANPVRISQVYGGGGGSTGTYLFDYIELFNSSGSAVSIGGWSVQYGSATGTSFGSAATNIANIPAGVAIAPCSYYLIQCSASGSAGAAFPVTPDLISTGPSMSGTTGKLALINNQTGGNLCSGNTSGAIYVDVVGYGTGNCFETADAPGTTSTSCVVRNGGGMADTDNNSLDFSLNANPVPRNSQTPQNVDCLATPSSNDTWGHVKSLYR